MTRRALVAVIAVLLWFGGAASVNAGTITWTDWISATVGTSGTATGTIGGVSVTYSGQVTPESQTSCGINYWDPASPYLSATVSNAPLPCDIVTLYGGATLNLNTVTFSSPVTDPVMAILSLGQDLGQPMPVTYTFSEAFTLLSSGLGYWNLYTGTPSSVCNVLSATQLQGVECHGALQFTGTFSSISWYASPEEVWHGFTFGVPEVAPVPEPASLMLFGLGLTGIAARLRGRRRN